MNNKELIKNLKSENTKTIISTLKYVSTEGNKEILPEVISLLHQSENTLIRNEVIKILEHLKDQNTVPTLINAIVDVKYTDELPLLVPVCWKNGLNFEDYIETFIDIFIQSEFQLAFDAFTVIDNFNMVNDKKADVSLTKLRKAIKNTTNSKEPLFYELMNIIEDKKESPTS